MLRNLLLTSLLLSPGLSDAAEFWQIDFALGTSPALSRDGLIVAGEVKTAAGRQLALWTATTGAELIDLPVGYDVVRVRGMSDDGKLVSGSLSSLEGREAFIWSRAAGYRLIEPPAGAAGNLDVYDVSDDGTAVGSFYFSETAQREAFSWTASGGLVLLGDLPGGQALSQANAISGDGSAIVGEANARGPDQQEPVIWTQQDGIVRLAADLEPGAFGWASDVSPDGKIVVGVAGWGHGSGGAFRWTTDMGTEFIGVYGNPTGVSDDGKVIVGSDNGPPDWGNTQGFTWQEGLGSRRVSLSLVHDHGLHDSVTAFGPVNAVSGDGTTVLGSIFRDGRNAFYLARLTDDALPGDVNFDDRVDLDDFAILRKGFGKGIYRDQGDTNLDRHVDLTDFGILKANLGTVRGAAVPEPKAFILLLVGILLLAGRSFAMRLATMSR